MTLTFDIMQDLDGVSTPWVDPFHPFLQQEHGIEVLTPWTTWHHYRTYNIVDDAFVKTLYKFAEQGLFTAHDPFPGVVQQFQRLADAGHRIHVVTDRPEPAHEGTRFWLDDHGFPYETLSFSRDKTIFKDFGPGPYFAIDDRVENVEAMRNAGIEAILLNWAWNEQALHLPRVHSVEEFVHYVLQLQDAFSDFG